MFSFGFRRRNSKFGDEDQAADAQHIPEQDSRASQAVEPTHDLARACISQPTSRSSKRRDPSESSDWRVDLADMMTETKGMLPGIVGNIPPSTASDPLSNPCDGYGDDRPGSVVELDPDDPANHRVGCPTYDEDE